MNFARRSLIPLLFIGMLLTSCGGLSSGSPTPDVDATVAAGAQTLVAAVFLTQTAIAPTATDTPLPSVTPLPTSSPLVLPSLIASATQSFLGNPVIPTPTGTYYTATPNPSTLASGCNNLAFVQDVTIESGTIVEPGAKFTNTWQVANTGTCDWVYGYRLVYVSGNRMGGSPGKLGKVIAPGKWTQLSVDLHAPDGAGTYTGSWRFSDGSGKMFGATLGVSIVVKSVTKTPSYP
jgi:Ig-like domain from next to BRCA1 gene